MELLTRNNFEDWMRKLTERLDRQDELLLSLQPSGKAPDPMDRIRMFDNQDLCMLLQISKRTLQRYRSIGALPYKTLGKKTYYSEEDVLTFLSEHVINNPLKHFSNGKENNRKRRADSPRREDGRDQCGSRA